MMYKTKEIHVSDIINKGKHGHKEIGFLDVVVNDDNLMFIDPVLLEKCSGSWFKEANETVESFFDELYKAYRENDESKKIKLLEHAQEQNGTRLGYGKGDNGKGNTADGLRYIFSPLTVLSRDISTIKKATDLPILIPGFSEDGLSDLLTNILHENLNIFTGQQLRLYGFDYNTELSFWTWDRNNGCFKFVTRPSFVYEGKELLLVPKVIVRRKYLFSTNQYFTRVILERLRYEGMYMYDGKTLPKKDIIKQKSYSGEHWKYDETIAYTKLHDDALEEYHHSLPFFYDEEGRRPTDDELDRYIYS